MPSIILNPQGRQTTLVLLAVAGLLALVSVAVGIDDNLPGILLAFLAATAFVLAFAHPWQTTRQFLFLLLASIAGFVLLVILNIMIDSAVQAPTSSDTFRELWQSPAFDVLNTIIAMICPAAFMVSMAGVVVMLVRRRRQAT